MTEWHDDRPTPDWTSKDHVDFLGNQIVVGDILAKADKSGAVPYITLCVVTKIQDSKIYLDNSKVSIQFPARCIIVTHLARVQDKLSVDQKLNYEKNKTQYTKELLSNDKIAGKYLI